MTDASPSSPPRILVTGASGLVGSALTRRFDQENLSWTPLSHREAGWNPERGELDPALLADTDTVVHLAGEPIANRRWTDEIKTKIRDSRVRGTRAIAEAMAARTPRPRTLVCASAIGLYGDGGDRILTEDTPAADGFLAEVVREWEAAADPARDAGIRVAHLRLGIVLSPRGGALAKMLPVFKLGLGGKIGRGRAWMSWIHLHDVAEAFLQAVQDPDINGPYNLVAPSPVRNADFTRALGNALQRPAILPVPPLALKIAMGEMASALLQSARVHPTRLTDARWRPRFPDLEPALRDLLAPENDPQKD